MLQALRPRYVQSHAFCDFGPPEPGQGQKVGVGPDNTGLGLLHATGPATPAGLPRARRAGRDPAGRLRPVGLSDTRRAVQLRRTATPVRNQTTVQDLHSGS